MTNTVFSQLPLELYLDHGNTFENFHTGNNAELIDSLCSFEHPLFYIWSEPGNGRSHLLQALCHHAEKNDIGSIYLPIQELAPIGPELLQGLESIELIIVDDVDAICGNHDWEEGLFHLFNKVRDLGHQLVISSSQPLNALNLTINDLGSRFGWGLNYYLEPLNDQQKLEAIKQRAQERGLIIGEDVLQYIVRHLPREPHKLFNLLEQLDKASLAAQRKITIPFIKSVLQG